MSNSITDIVNKSSVLKIGTVISVEGRSVKVLVDREKNTSHLFYKGSLVKSIVVGSYVKITKGFEELVGKIEGEYIEEDAFQSQKNYNRDTEKIRRILIISLLGYFNNLAFERGIKELPLIDNECFLLDESEFNEVHHFIKKDDIPLHIGQLAQERGMPISLGVNGLFASHIGIFGNTGSGKSYTLANLYHTLFQQYKDKIGFKNNADFFLIDFNGEYIDEESNDDIIIESAYKNTYRLSTHTQEGGDKFPIPEKVIQEPLFWTVLLEATEKTQKPFIKNTLENRYINDQLVSSETYKNFIKTIIVGITKNKDKSLEKALVVNFLRDLLECSDELTGFNEAIQFFESSLKYHNKNSDYYFDRASVQTYSSDDNFDKLIEEAIKSIQAPVDTVNTFEKIRIKLVSSYYNDIVRGYSNKEHLSPLISRLKTRIPDLIKVVTIKNDVHKNSTKNFTIVSMKNLNIHMRKILPLLFCKHLYDEKKKANKNQETFLNIIIDEAHNIMSESSQRESEQWKDYRLETFEEIIKEGRKFGVFLTIASQRPSDISPTIISQLHNYFLHRLINNNDIKAIERTISYLDKVSFESLPILPTGTCILAGLIAQVPVVIEINKINDQYKPFNQTIEPTKHWS
ncbi:TPA: ATP-binding protein [Legionella pneumophila]|uniref:ATP-binding protein n=1 Tax=Legionella pneumophila TaxID=446 RepID=UPI0005192AC3|nr:ATP-binding protein [Legionella pneumophila]MDW8957633.1 ATP-binding protein [Legionella pneumophila]MDW9008832.1 ATP-binding protein [Legionella pneumophila]STX69183.1 Type IV secretory pathway, VirB4 components [Legionella pneumophila]HAT1803908.1 ATP-binding protein [Legionella pneumophila]HAT1826911.1 ATP-binding protein [Legionella pneumophila]